MQTHRGTHLPGRLVKLMHSYFPLNCSLMRFRICAQMFLCHSMPNHESLSGTRLMKVTSADLIGPAGTTCQ